MSFVRKVHHPKWTQLCMQITELTLNRKKKIRKRSAQCSSIAALSSVLCFWCLAFKNTSNNITTTQHISSSVHTILQKIYSWKSKTTAYEMLLTWYRQRIDTRKIKGRPFCITLLQKQEANAAFDKHQGNLIFSDYLSYWSSQFVCNGHFRSKWVWFTLFTAKYTLAND